MEEHTTADGASSPDAADPASADDAPEQAAAPAGGRNLPVAIVVGLLLGGLFIGTLFATSTWWFTGAVIVFTAVATWEAGTVLGTDGGRAVARPVLVVTAVVMGVATHALGPEGQVLGLLVLTLGAFGWDLASQPRVEVVDKLGTTLLLGVWVVFLASFAILIVDPDTGGPSAMLAVGGGAIFGDVGGYAWGRMFGRRKIAPTVSPNKTWEGLVGGVLTSGLLAYFVLPMVDAELFAQPMDGVVIAVVAAIAGFFGDLAESMVKRDAGLKDLGTLLPGHGGMLDRVDGLLLAFPVGYYALTLVA